jgi:glycosyltransferase involved in cell wall biosynthesis
MGNLDTLLYYGGSAYQFRKFSLLSTVFKYKLIAHIVEWDPELPRATIKQKRAALNFFQSVLKFSDGIVVISNFLEEQIAKENYKSIPVFRLPILVDTEAWADKETLTFNTPYILYCANLESYIEDVFFILRSFADLKDKSIKLEMIGYAGESTLTEINKEINKLNIEGRVMISSKFVDQMSLYKLFASADVLLAPMHDNNRSAARFPLKIADYLMSGRPVVSSHIGEVAATLKDGVSAFLAKADDLADFTKKMEIALNHPNKLQIALSGREIAIKNFDYNMRHIDSF